MLNEIDKEVAKKLIGKKINFVVSKGSVLTLRFEGDSELVIEEGRVPGADGGMHWSTKFTFKNPPVENWISIEPGREETLFQT